MSRKRRDIIPTATSQLVPKLAYSGVVQENIAESADGYSTVMDHLEIASTYSEQERER